VLENVAACVRCGSTNTTFEMVIPSRDPSKLRGKNEDQMVEIRCRECGKINRTFVKVQIK